MSDTSKAALKSMRPYITGMRWKILGMMLICDSTCDEIEEWAGMRHQTASARICELRDRQYITDTGKRRKTRTGRNAAIYRLTRKGLDALSID